MTMDETGGDVNRSPSSEQGNRVPAILAGLLVVVLLAVVALTVYETRKVADFASDLRDSAVSACESQNDVRTAERIDSRAEIDSLKLGIVEDRNLSPKFFPSIPPKKFKRLVQQGIDDTREQIRDERNSIKLLANRDCEAEYPPL